MSGVTLRLVDDFFRVRMGTHRDNRFRGPLRTGCSMSEVDLNRVVSSSQGVIVAEAGPIIAANLARGKRHVFSGPSLFWDVRV